MIKYIAQQYRKYRILHRFNTTFFGQIGKAEKLCQEQIQRFNSIKKTDNIEGKIRLLFCDHYDIYRNQGMSRKNSLHLANIAVRTLYEQVAMSI